MIKLPIELKNFKNGSIISTELELTVTYKTEKHIRLSLGDIEINESDLTFLIAAHKRVNGRENLQVTETTLTAYLGRYKKSIIFGINTVGIKVSLLEFMNEHFKENERIKIKIVTGIEHNASNKYMC